MKEIATSQYDFAALREGDEYVYVDKTDMLAELALRKQDAHYFIARPRRFGKSLMLSTLRYMFEGRRDLFRGLKVEKTKWDWSKTYPVIMLNMSKACGETPEDVKDRLHDLAGEIAKKYGLEVKSVRAPGLYFCNVLEALSEKMGRFVVLVDEYDVPLQGFLGEPKNVRRVRQIMHDFYVQLKNNVGAIRFLMITGVTKLTKLSVFSGLNNPTDLTINFGDYAALLGYTHAELREYFGDHIAAFGAKLGIKPQKAYDELLRWYDSYRFSPFSEARVINPVALGQALNAGTLATFWSSTGMPSLVVERLSASAIRPDQLDGIEARLSDLDVCDAVDLPWMPLLYQSGYLTIKDVTWETSDEEGGDVPRPVMKLGVPNYEVRDALSGLWWKSLMHIEESDFTALVHVAERQIAEGNIDCLLSETLYQLYAKLPPTWTPKNEADAKRYFLLFMEMAGAKMQPEKPSAHGFADAVVETKKGVWVMEFKFNRSAASAIRQIRERGYADAYVDANFCSRRQKTNRPSSTSISSLRLGRGQKTASTKERDAAFMRPVTLVGIKFDPKIRNIDVPKFEPL